MTTPLFVITTIIVSLLLGIMVAGAASGGSQVELVKNSIDEYEKGIKKVIKDDEREEQALAEMDTVREELEAQMEQISEATKGYIEVDNRYETTLAQYDTELDSILGSFEQLDRWSIDKHYSIQKHFTDEEWPKAIKRVNKGTKDLLKDINKKIAKFGKTQTKQARKYKKKFGKDYTKPLP